MGRIRCGVSLAWQDFWGGFDRCLTDTVSLGRLILGLAIGWWVYVPLHELLHALACVAFGGTVTLLEIAPLYGGHLYAAIFPFVEAGGEYAGRLAGFDTGGSFWVYLATDLGPYLLTLFPGVWAWRRAGHSGRALAFGFWISFALAPFISLTGDAYEIGSLVITQLAPWQGMPQILGDDLFKVAQGLSQLPDPPWIGFILATVLGIMWSFATYALAGWISDRLGVSTPPGLSSKDVTALTAEESPEQGAP